MDGGRAWLPDGLQLGRDAGCGCAAKVRCCRFARALRDSAAPAAYALWGVGEQ